MLFHFQKGSFKSEIPKVLSIYDFYNTCYCSNVLYEILKNEKKNDPGHLCFDSCGYQKVDLLITLTP